MKIFLVPLTILLISCAQYSSDRNETDASSQVQAGYSASDSLQIDYYVLRKKFDLERASSIPKEDEKCEIVSDTCGCTAGGSRKAVLKNQGNLENNEGQNGVFCAAVMSKHPSCKEGLVARYIDGQCQLVHRSTLTEPFPKEEFQKYVEQEKLKQIKERKTQ